MTTPEPIRWRVELHLDGLPTEEQQFAIVGHLGITSITGDHDADLCVISHVAEGQVPTMPLINVIAVLETCAPNLKINAVQITKAMSEKEAAAWVGKQFKSMKVSWKSSQDL